MSSLVWQNLAQCPKCFKIIDFNSMVGLQHFGLVCTECYNKTLEVSGQ